ncbi:hypothetical protein CES85_1065 [Ochrobactrum quorumnocens]|uniref:Uncharacterized protein n=1 Tax=Ochrobactrum quorumnocens TaxID=271865 RepID=A0A248UK70_9HYPH|nr:hypothetical protein [[Ochrobactrum] quorumnocens]ASV87078.1 hypothetical protein CES85_1065 [[Ochrobactrum] quorumnocens]
MSRPGVFAQMGGAFVASLGNVEIELTIAGVVQAPLRGIFRSVRDTDLINLEGIAAEGIRYTLAIQGNLIDAVRQGDMVKILESDDSKNVGDVFEIAGHVDDGRAMKRLLLQDH